MLWLKKFDSPTNILDPRPCDKPHPTAQYDTPPSNESTMFLVRMLTVFLDLKWKISHIYR